MGKNQKRRAIDKIKFSIGTKLITIITIIVVVSLGSIIALVSWLVREDLRIMAEENNFEANRRAAVEADTLLVNMRANSRLLIQALTTAANGESANQMTNLFFTENPQIAGVYYIAPNRTEQTITNRQFFTSRELDTNLANEWFNSQRPALGRSARGEIVVLNATLLFERPMLSLFFPLQSGGAGTVGAVLFSSEELNNSFGYGLNLTYMINSEGEVLAHSNFDLVLLGQSLADNQIVKEIMENTSKNSQFLADFGEGTDRVREFTAFTKIDSPGTIVITSIEYNKVFEGIDATTRRNIYLTIAVLSISILFIRFFSKSISLPLRALATAARNIEGGIFEINIKKRKSKDEIGILNGSFQQMCTALNIFGRFTNKEIAVKAMRNEIKPGGLPKHATIFFSDIRSFTAISENFTKVFGKEASNRIVFWLNNYLTKMVECVEKTNGVIDKFIGDAVMAHWGTAYSAGSPRKDAFNCVVAALMMRKALYYMNKGRSQNDPSNPIIHIGCGINTGIVTAGQIGSDLRMEYTVIGDPVNLASRIEALTKPLGADILISEDTWRLIGDKILTEEMPSVTVKGKEKPVRIFAVINFKGEPKGPQTMADVRKLLVINPPDLSKADVNAEEKKYKIGTDNK